MRRLLIAGFLAAAASIAGAAPAAAALEFRPCPGTPDYDCAALPVALDPAAPAGELLTLHVRQLSETRDGREVLVALAGGPGQSSTLFIDDFADVLAEGLADRRLVVVDLRGTGGSGALRCPALAGLPGVVAVPRLADRVGRCGAELGERRRFFTTSESVADLEALRVALGVDRLSLFGVSHGAYVAQRYARAYPGRVDRLVLDSPVAQDQGGPFDRSSYAAVRRVLRRLCAGPRCPGVGDPVAALRRLARRLAEGPIAGTVVDARGRRRLVRLADQGELFDLMVASDFSEALRGALPAAVRAAARGDATPLLRLVALERGEADPRQVDERNEHAAEFSNALFFATTCQEKPLPWGSPAASVEGRERARESALDALGGSAFAPFGRAAAASTQVGSAFCSRWPETTAAPVPPVGAIDAVGLVLSGETDLRTPLEEARPTAAAIRDGSLLRVPGAGHAVVSRHLPCVEAALRRFFLDAAVGNPCAGARAPAAAPAPVAPRRLRDVRRDALGGRGALRGGGIRTAAAVVASLADAVRLAAIPAVLDRPFRAGGLRGGVICAAPGPRAGDGSRPLVLRVRRLRYVRDLALSGRASVHGTALTALDVALRGPGGTRGTLRLRGRRLTGRLGSRAVDARGAALRRLPRLTIPSALGSGRTSCG